MKDSFAHQKYLIYAPSRARAIELTMHGPKTAPALGFSTRKWLVLLVIACLGSLPLLLDPSYRSGHIVQECAKKPRVCTYFEDVFVEDAAEDYQAMLQLWKSSWRNQGWETTVLTEADAARHPNYTEWRAIFAGLPTVNDRGYELACYLRWVAAIQSGCGWLSDVDVLNYGFPPQHALSGPVLYTFEGPVPALVTGERVAFEAVVLAFVQVYQRIIKNLTDESIQSMNGAPHTSDMYILASRPDLYFDLRFPLSLYSPGARNLSVLLHYNKNEVKNILGHGDKVKAVQTIRALPTPRMN